MSRMIPAKVRSEGVALFKAGLLREIERTDYVLIAEVDDNQVKYDLDGSQDFCSCVFFEQNKRYCKHIAAVEEYLKANESPKAQTASGLSKLEDNYQAGSQFLDKLDAVRTPSSQERLRLEVKIGDSLDLYDVFARERFIYLDFRLYSNRLKRSYVIKDIETFLGALRRADSYTTAKITLEPLLLESFDEASQQLLELLLKLTGKRNDLDKQLLFVKSARYLRLPFLFAEPVLDMVAELKTFELELEGKSLSYYSYLGLAERTEGAEELYHFKVESQQDYIELSMSAEDFISFYDDQLLYYDQVFYQVSPEQKQLLDFAQKELLGQTVKIAYPDKDKLAQALDAFSKLGSIAASDYFTIKKFNADFKFSLGSQELGLDIRFDYGDFFIDHFQDLETLDFSRDLRKENKIFNLMKSFNFPKSFHSKIKIDAAFVEEFFIDILPAFERVGKVVLAEELSELRIDDLPAIEIDRKGGLLDISFDLPDVSEQEFGNIIKQLEKNADYYVSESGRFYQFGKAFDGIKTALSEMEDVYQIRGNSLEIPTSRTFQVSKIFEGIGNSQLSTAFRNFYEQLTNPELYPYEKPEIINAELRGYQETGVRWLKMLSHYHLGGILADDMGLGKTLQAITFLMSVLKSEDRVLITAPASLTYNWASELGKFATGSDFVVVDGNKADRDAILAGTHQIFITSYGSFLKDFDAYQAMNLTYLLLDEAQVVKNYSSKTNRALTSLNVEHSFALSGTPLENRIEEIWAIFRVVMPGFLPKREKFNKLQASSIARMIQPFIMRRKKEDVLEELPDKMETVLINQLEEEQKMLYLGQLELMQQQVSNMSSRDISRSRMEILAGITRLRQICDTPALFMEDYKGKSGKLESLRELLEQVKASGHRPLIFSQFTKVFPHIEQIMSEVGMDSYVLTGSTLPKDRLAMVQAFNAGSRDAFLVSLKAGGVGLNLTSADVVILVDLWWNPAVEEQAIARAHRMGQKNTVEVIRLITQGTIEEKMVEIQARKKDLIANVLDGDVATTSLSESEIKEILGL